MRQRRRRFLGLKRRRRSKHCFPTRLNEIPYLNKLCGVEPGDHLNDGYVARPELVESQLRDMKNVLEVLSQFHFGITLICGTRQDSLVGRLACGMAPPQNGDNAAGLADLCHARRRPA